MLYMNWNIELAYLVTPKSGPMRAMRTLGDVNRAYLDDLSAQRRLGRHWFAVGRLLMAAATSESRIYVMLATDALLMALEIEGWMTRQPRVRKAKVHEMTAPTSSRRPADKLELPLALAA